MIILTNSIFFITTSYLANIEMINTKAKKFNFWIRPVTTCDGQIFNLNFSLFHYLLLLYLKNKEQGSTADLIHFSCESP